MPKLVLILGLFAMAPFAIGCNDSGNGGAAGSGGTGGSGGTDLGCNQGQCLLDDQAAADCTQLVAACIANEAPEEQCVIAGLCVFCLECGAGGSGGTGGSAGTGGAGGAGGSGGSGLFCNEGACVDDAVATKCKTAVAACIKNEAPEEECIAGANILYCDLFWPSDCDSAVCRCSSLNTPCTISCAETGCNQECDGNGVQCTAECPNGGCSQECDNGASCEFTCDGGGCKQECENDATSCAKTCTGGNCTE
jgi:hypothetical protein